MVDLHRTPDAMPEKKISLATHGIVESVTSRTETFVFQSLGVMALAHNRIHVIFLMCIFYFCVIAPSPPEFTLSKWGKNLIAVVRTWK